MDGHLCPVDFRKLPCQVYGVAFRHQVEVVIAPAEEQVAHHPSDQVKALSPVGGYKTGCLHELHKFRGQLLFNSVG